MLGLVPSMFRTIPDASLKWNGNSLSVCSLRKKSDNSFMKLIMEIIKRDSEKHKVMQQFIIDSFTREAMHLSPEELIPLGDVLEQHIKAEAKSMGLANACVPVTKNFFANFVASPLLSDEVKHHEMLTTLDQVKGKIHSIVP